MKVLLINHFPLTGSGSGVYTENLANSLIKKGHEVRIILPENIKIDNPLIHPVYFTDKKTFKEALPFNFPCFTTHPRSTKTFYELTNNELNLYVTCFNKAINEEINNFNPDIIHSGHIWILSDLATKYDIPTVVTAHGTDLIGFNKDPRCSQYAIDVAVKCNNIITISKENEELVNKIFPFASNKTVLIQNGYDKDVFYPEKLNKKEVLEQLNINKDFNKIVCFAGKFTEAKGIDILLKAAKIYEDEETLTILAGNGELFNEMKDLSQELGLKNVYFLGNQPHDVLRKIYNVADVSIVPSRSEAFGLVVIEALACSTPVIGSNEGGIKDIINDEVGILFPKDDYITLAHEILNVFNNKKTFNRHLISDYAKDNYNQDLATDKLIELYKDLINTKTKIFK